MSLATVFDQCRQRNEMALVCYLTAGYPSPAASLAIVDQVVAAGADVIEIGIPFSDPIADGPTIQHASHAALMAGTSLRILLATLRDHPIGAPAVIMSYLNPLLAYGRDALLADLRTARLEGLIVPDLPADESAEWVAAARAHRLAMVHMAAPTSTDNRLREIGRRSDAFVYAVSVTGTTGARRDLGDEVPAFLDRVRQATGRPVAVGFGISSPQHIERLRGHADGVVVGSRLVEAIRNDEDITALVRSLKAATRSESCLS